MIVLHTTDNDFGDSENETEQNITNDSLFDTVKESRLKNPKSFYIPCKLFEKRKENSNSLF